MARYGGCGINWFGGLCYIRWDMRNNRERNSRLYIFGNSGLCPCWMAFETSMIPHWVLIVLFAMPPTNGDGGHYLYHTCEIQDQDCKPQPREWIRSPPIIGNNLALHFASRDLCEAAERKLVADLGAAVAHHQCALAAAGDNK